MITVERAREAFAYDSTTGVLIRRIATSSNRIDRIGQPAGGKNSAGYILVDIDRHRYLAHRLIWLHAHGCWPTSGIDHINGNRADNRLCNLRLATESQNQANRPKPKNNTSGHKGVSWHKQSKKWRACIEVNGEKFELGEFRDKEMARIEYAKAAIQHFGEYVNVD